ncbi:flagellar export protein FliJ [Pseudogulbenkiania subflava]|uniref:Flagellar FliJ protein n=1 Tax=Pseudogulbenkiania subflava DSM 22618 TaxID=1123014 RepID=A0A1Y6BR83_9NEIS|nr:flagellar export protein FliJ [Pseudogulbenkiania subflava]SMF24915.1 flagellar FliJ protein [Pseudogulbenkiania subflava DSM 22618]
MKPSKYALLVRLAEEKQEASAERMRQAQARLAEALSRLDQLGAFRNEYRQRLLQGGGQGMAVAQWQDFHRFIARLDEAMATQQTEVDRCKQTFLLARQAWNNERKQLKAFETLIERERARQEVLEAKRQQKLSDEFATRRFWDRQHED